MLPFSPTATVVLHPSARNSQATPKCESVLTMVNHEPLPESAIIKPVWTDWEVIGCLVCLPLTTFPFALRCYAKLKLNRRPLIEDCE